MRCSKETLDMTVMFLGQLENKTIASLETEGPPPLLTSTLSPFGLTLASVKVNK